MPISLTRIMDVPAALLSMTPIAGTSLITTAVCPAVCNTMLGETGRPASASVGTPAALPHRHPTQIGEPASPFSNSIHTPAPIGGTRYTPMGGPVGPASGTHGSAQL